MNIKNKAHPNVKCTYPVKKGDFCSRHWKNPRRFLASTATPSTRAITGAVKKVQKWWRQLNGLRLFRARTPAFFVRDLCHNDSELATFEPLSTVQRDYFFVIRESGKFWGFDIRALLIQYESSGKLENPYTITVCDSNTLEAFRKRLDSLRRWKKQLVFDNTAGLTVKQSWNMRVLDVCLRLDMLGYRIATQWFCDLPVSEHRALYISLFTNWSAALNLSDELKERIVPEYNAPHNRLFRVQPDRVYTKHDLDSIRRMNLNIMERLISSASQQSDKTLGAMYVVMSLCTVSGRCRSAYPWLSG